MTVILIFSWPKQIKSFKRVTFALSNLNFNEDVFHIIKRNVYVIKNKSV